MRYILIYLDVSALILLASVNAVLKPIFCIYLSSNPEPLRYSLDALHAPCFGGSVTRPTDYQPNMVAEQNPKRRIGHTFLVPDIGQRPKINLSERTVRMVKTSGRTLSSAREANACKIVVEKPKGNRVLQRRMRIKCWEDKL